MNFILLTLNFILYTFYFPLRYHLAKLATKIRLNILQQNAGSREIENLIV